MKNVLQLVGVIGAMSSLVAADVLRISSYVKNAGPCPDNFTGNVPNPVDCHTFYICDAGLPSLFPCPLDLCFNPEAGDGTGGGCDHCELVPGCGGVSAAPTTGAPSTPAPTTRPPSTAAPSTSAPPSSSAAPPESTTTAPSTSPPVTASPSTTPAPTTTSVRTTTPDNGNLSCPSDVPYIYMPYPGDCNKFYYCVEGQNIGVSNCQPGLWFRFSLQVCDRPWASTCVE